MPQTNIDSSATAAPRKSVAATKLRAWRKAERLNQTDVAKAVGCLQKMISNFELGKSVPSGARMLKLSQISKGAVPLGDWQVADGADAAHGPAAVSGRVVAPGISDNSETRSNQGRQEHAGNGGRGSGRGRSHPLVKGLFDALPTTKEMSLADRVRWLKAAEVNLSFAYESAPDDTGEIEIRVKRSLPIHEAE